MWIYHSPGSCLDPSWNCILLVRKTLSLVTSFHLPTRHSPWYPHLAPCPLQAVSPSSVSSYHPRCMYIHTYSYFAYVHRICVKHIHAFIRFCWCWSNLVHIHCCNCTITLGKCPEAACAYILHISIHTCMRTYLFTAALQMAVWGVLWHCSPGPVPRARSQSQPRQRGGVVEDSGRGLCLLCLPLPQSNSSGVTGRESVFASVFCLGSWDPNSWEGVTYSINGLGVQRTHNSIR